MQLRCFAYLLMLSDTFRSFEARQSTIDAERATSSYARTTRSGTCRSAPYGKLACFQEQFGDYEANTVRLIGRLHDIDHSASVRPEVAEAERDAAGLGRAAHRIRTASPTRYLPVLRRSRIDARVEARLRDLEAISRKIRGR